MVCSNRLLCGLKGSEKRKKSKVKSKEIRDVKVRRKAKKKFLRPSVWLILDNRFHTCGNF